MIYLKLRAPINSINSKFNIKKHYNNQKLESKTLLFEYYEGKPIKINLLTFITIIDSELFEVKDIYSMKNKK